MATKDLLIVRIVDTDGVVGYGEAAAMPPGTYVGDDIDTTESVIRTAIAPLLRRTTLAWIGELHEIARGQTDHPFAIAGLEAALWHVIAQRCDTPLWQLWGGTNTHLPTGSQISIIRDVDVLLARIAERVESGVHRLRLKIAPGWDIEPLKAIRKSFPDLTLVADANGSYTFEDLENLRSIDALGLTAFEQPLSGDIANYATLASELETPICLDESILGVDDARAAINAGACAMFNIKAPRVGGIANALVIAELAKANGISTWCGGMYETGLGRAFNFNLMSRSEFDLPGDTDSPLTYYSRDIMSTKVEPVRGFIDLGTSGPLGGWSVNESAITNLTASPN